MRLKIDFDKETAKSISSFFGIIFKDIGKGLSNLTKWITKNSSDIGWLILTLAILAFFSWLLFISIRGLYRSITEPDKVYMITLIDSTRKGCEPSINVDVSLIKNRNYNIEYNVNNVYKLELSKGNTIEYIMFINKNVSVEPFENFKTLYDNYKYFAICERFSDNSTFISHYKEDIDKIIALCSDKNKNIKEINALCTSILNNVSKEGALGGEIPRGANTCETFGEFAATDQIVIIKVPDINIGDTLRRTVYFKDSSYVFK